MDVTQKRPYDGTYNTLQGSQLHERLSSTRRRDGDYGAGDSRIFEGEHVTLGGR
jgi:hypothetical protein